MRYPIGRLKPSVTLAREQAENLTIEPHLCGRTTSPTTLTDASVAHSMPSPRPRRQFCCNIAVIGENHQFQDGHRQGGDSPLAAHIDLSQP
jgi:hypothetical protein